MQGPPCTPLSSTQLWPFGAGCRHDTVGTEEREQKEPTAGDHSNGMGRAAGLWLPCSVAKPRGAEPPDDVRGGLLHGLCPSSSQRPASICFRCIRAQGWTPLLCVSLNLTLMKDSDVPFCEVEPHPQFPDAWNPKSLGHSPPCPLHSLSAGHSRSC